MKALCFVTFLVCLVVGIGAFSFTNPKEETSPFVLTITNKTLLSSKVAHLYTSFRVNTCLDNNTYFNESSISCETSLSKFSEFMLVSLASRNLASCFSPEMPCVELECSLLDSSSSYCTSSVTNDITQVKYSLSFDNKADVRTFQFTYTHTYLMESIQTVFSCALTYDFCILLFFSRFGEQNASSSWVSFSKWVLFVHFFSPTMQFVLLILFVKYPIHSSLPKWEFFVFFLLTVLLDLFLLCSIYLTRRFCFKKYPVFESEPPQSPVELAEPPRPYEVVEIKPPPVPLHRSPTPSSVVSSYSSSSSSRVCPICFISYGSRTDKEPIMLRPCYHMMCQGCFFDMQKRSQETQKKVSCPSCTQEVQEPSSFLSQL